jgi:hypothetical protein
MSSRVLGLVLAVAMIGFGTLFTLQGLGYVGGSSMSGSQTWAVLGPLIAGLGVALGIVILQRR